MATLEDSDDEAIINPINIVPGPRNREGDIGARILTLILTYTVSVVKKIFDIFREVFQIGLVGLCFLIITLLSHYQDINNVETDVDTDGGSSTDVVLTEHDKTVLNEENQIMKANYKNHNCLGILQTLMGTGVPLETNENQSGITGNNSSLPETGIIHVKGPVRQNTEDGFYRLDREVLKETESNDMLATTDRKKPPTTGKLPPKNIKSE